MKNFIKTLLVIILAWMAAEYEDGGFILYLVVFYTALMVAEGFEYLQERIYELQDKVEEIHPDYGIDDWDRGEDL